MTPEGLPDAKPWWMSRAILGGAVAILAGFFGSQPPMRSILQSS